MRGTYTLAAGIVGLALVAGSARAQTDYEVTPQAGPWMICVASFTGPPAKELTETMIQELRSKHNLPAYSFCRSAELRRQERERVEQEKQFRRAWADQRGLPPDVPLVRSRWTAGRRRTGLGVSAPTAVQRNPA